MLPTSTTLALVEEEMEVARAWADRHSFPISWNAEALTLMVTLKRPGSEDLFFLNGTFEHYNVHPPAWSFCNESWEPSRDPAVFPAAGESSVFHPNRIICAPFNRLAFGTLHGDWPDLAQWMTVAPNAVRARTIGEMLSVILRDLSRSPGRIKS